VLAHDGPVLVDLKVTPSPVPTGGPPRRGTQEAMRDVVAALEGRS
jgi:hypothetical protein